MKARRSEEAKAVMSSQFPKSKSLRYATLWTLILKDFALLPVTVEALAAAEAAATVGQRMFAGPTALWTKANPECLI